jgi:membrane-bound lytic murein transglycosylase D
MTSAKTDAGAPRPLTTGTAAKSAPTAEPLPKPRAKVTPPATPATRKGSEGKASESRASAPARGAGPVRRAIAGAPTEAESARGAESPELALLREADRELFAPASPPIGQSWPADFPFPVPIDPARPAVHASGFPPAVRFPDPPANDGPRDLAWLRGLSLPDLPVRWDARVVRYLEYYRDEPRGRALIASWMKRSGRYAAAARRVLREQGVPEDLLWASLVESGFDPVIRSPAGAAGLWQLMPAGAKVYGLSLDRWIDERLDPERSTEAAARYLADLHRRFGSWELALAGYNMGYGGLLAAIRKYNTNDYWELSRLESGIPWETTLYVPKIIAMAVVAKNFTAFGLDALKMDPPVVFEEVVVPGGVSLRTVAAAAGVDVSDIEALNPQIRAGRTPPRDPASEEPTTWKIRVPPGKGQGVRQKFSAAPPSDVKLARYVARFGDSIDTIARAMHVSRAKLLECNAMRSDEFVRAGTVLLVPPASPVDAAAKPEKSEEGEKLVAVVPVPLARVSGRRRIFYRVVAGDTLREIAATFRVGEDDLRRYNALDPAARLHEGMMLLVLVPEAMDLSKVVCFPEDAVRVLVAGSDEFFAYFEGLRGRTRTTIAVQEGDTWEKIGKRYDLTTGQLERINRRSHTEKLAPNETLVVYAPIGQKMAHRTQTPLGSDPAPLVPMVAPNPEDLPPLPEPAARAPGVPGTAQEP